MRINKKALLYTLLVLVLAGCSIDRGTGAAVEDVGEGVGSAVGSVGAGVGDVASGVGDAASDIAD